ncbi:MAG: hypothetical protein ACLP22_04675 [Solirubrobacteraceae bacterium]
MSSGRARHGLTVALLLVVLVAGLTGALASAAQAAGNASSAAGFLEKAQNSDGGFGAQQGEKSDPTASL